MSTECKEFGYFRGYRCVLITLKNKKGFSASFTNFGADIQSLCVPDRDGNFSDVVLGYDTLEGYVNGTASFGATVGRFANRIGGAKFTLNGTEYILSDNDNGNTLHGGAFGYNKRPWLVEQVCDGDEPFVVFKLISPDGEEHFPGTLTITARYTLLSDGLKIEYRAVTDKDTVLNLTNHSYFNLKGEGNGNTNDHIVRINAARYTPLGDNYIPIGTIAYVTGTPFDFQNPKRVGDDMDNGKLSFGYDLNYILGDEKEMRTAAEVYEPTTGRVMQVKTDTPAMQFYNSPQLNGDDKGKNGHSYIQYGGLCFESQFTPDSPNKKNFPSCVLKAGEEYHYTTIYQFSVKK